MITDRCALNNLCCPVKDKAHDEPCNTAALSVIRRATASLLLVLRHEGGLPHCLITISLFSYSLLTSWIPAVNLVGQGLLQPLRI
ncbi:hypothetical protein Dda3937_04602 [Dickeya dadantii 3937]|uniref:Uncharacterized protein n=1 Tax=Dickeya dadantii (strain 3937) TaxID=198628 RepID=E0SEA1_DICD3|nr:hypothetical protein Dda3937_04602 [Dickeya dadantii 3937]